MSKVSVGSDEYIELRRDRVTKELPVGLAFPADACDMSDIVTDCEMSDEANVEVSSTRTFILAARCGHTFLRCL